MKKLSLIIGIICLFFAGAIAQTQPKTVKKNAQSAVAKPDSAEVYNFTKPQASFLFQMLEQYRKFVSPSDEVTARQANKQYLPAIDSLEKILSTQAQAYIAANAAKRKAQEQLKAKADSVKNKQVKTK